MLPVDMELKKAFQDLQKQTISTREKVQQLKTEIEITHRYTLGLKLVLKALDSLKPEHKTYESVGRIFVLEDRQNVKQSINRRMKQNDEKVELLEQTKTYQESKVKEAENSIRELIIQKQNTTK